MYSCISNQTTFIQEQARHVQCGTCSNCSISAALYFQPANFVFLYFFVCNCEKINNVTASPLCMLPPPKKRLEYLDAICCHFTQNLLNPLNFCQNNRIFIVQLNMTRRHVILEFFRLWLPPNPVFVATEASERETSK